MSSIIVSKQESSNKLLWNELAELNSNFFQNTIYDQIQSLYKNKPIYFELWEAEKLIAGVKIYYWESIKLGNISKAVSKFIFQYGELICDPLITDQTEIAKRILKLQTAVDQFIKDEQIVSAQIYGVYGNPELLLKFNFKSKDDFHFNSAYVDLCEDNGDQFYNKFNRNTKRNLKKALDNNLEFSELNDSDLFHETLKKIFSQQIPVKPPPHKKLTDQYFNLLSGKFELSTHQVKRGNEILAVSLFVKYGTNAYSLFGGSIKNDIGAGHYLYYELMKLFRQQKICKFYFGQVAQEGNEDNKKFSIGITGFKKGFGLTELPSYKKTYIFNPIKNTLWEIMKRMGGLTAGK